MAAGRKGHAPTHTMRSVVLESASYSKGASSEQWARLMDWCSAVRGSWSSPGAAASQNRGRGGLRMRRQHQTAKQTEPLLRLLL